MSVNVQIDLVGAEEFAQAMKRLDEETQTQVHNRLAQWAETVKAEATRLAPARTGYLRSSVYAKTLDWEAQVGAEAVYAASVEFGTSHAQARPFIQPALEAKLPELERVLLDALDLAKSEAGL